MRVLGAVEFVTPGGPVPAGGPVQRAVLAHLALHVGHSTEVERLLREVWGPDAATSERRSLATLLSRLRRTVEPFGWSIDHQAGAYRLECDGPATDVQQFRSEVEHARHADPVDAVELLGRALDRWTGDALAGLDAPFAEDWRRRLTSERHRAMELLARGYLALGQHDDAVMVLEDLTARTPYAEDHWALLVETLHRAGRPQAALAAYRTIDRLLRDDLGIDPGPELRAAELAVLERDRLETERTAGTLHRSPFVGRFSEVVALREAIEAALAGDGTTVLVRGEPGIGKSRLVDEVVAALPTTVRVATGACRPEDSSPAVALLEPLVRAVGIDELDQLGPAGEDLRRLLVPGATLDPELLGLVRARLASAAAAATTHLCASAPLVVVVDDVHHADPVTAHLLQQLADLPASRPLCLLMTERSGTASWAEHSGTQPVEVTVDRLPASEAAVLARSLLVDHDPLGDDNRPISIVEAAGGVPLLVEQLAAEIGSAASGANGLRQTVESRLAELDDAARAVLEVAAVDGVRFWLVAVADAAEVPLATTARAIDVAQSLALVDRGASGHPAFTHALLRDAVLARVGPTARAVHHAALARAHDRHHDAIHAAHHAAAGYHLLDPADAGRILVSGADEALDTGRFDDAARWFRLATEIPGLGREQRLHAQIGLGASLMCADDPGGRDHLELALRRAVEAREWTCAADALQRRGRIGDAPDAAAVAEFTTMAERVLAGLGTDDPVRSARVLSLVFHAHVVQDPVTAGGYLDRLCDLDQRDHETATITSVCRYRHDVVHNPADPSLTDRGALLREDLGQSRHTVGAVLVATLEVAAHLQAGTAPPASACEAVERGAQTLGRPDVGLVLDLADAATAIGRDPLEVADRTLMDVIDRAVAAGAAGTVLFHSFALRREQRRASELLPMLLALPDAATDPATAVLASICLRESGDEVGAADRVDAAVATITSASTGWTLACAAAMAVEELSVTHRAAPPTFLDRAEALLTPSSGVMLVFAQVAMHLGPTDRYLALVCRARGDDDGFDRLNRAAAAQATAAGLANHVMWCQADRVLAGRTDVDRQALRRAAQRHGCVRLVRTLDGPA